jgi:RNA polymerase sigma-70 factor (ECF subfamily)
MTLEPGDRALVEAFLERRDGEAFRALYRRFSPALYRTALSLLDGAARDAEDVVQDTWIRAASRFDSFRWESSLRTWLTGIVINRCRELRRQRLRRPDRIVPPVTAFVSAPDDRLDLGRALRRLPPRARAVLWLHDVEGYTHAEIAAVLGVEAGTSKSQLFRARGILRRLLGSPS